MRSTRSTTSVSTVASEYPSWGAIYAALKHPVFEYNGARRIVRNLLWSPPQIPVVDLKAIGYSNPATKLKALDRMYFSPEEADRVRAMLKKRAGQSYSAILMSMHAGAKRSDSMGHCITSIAFSLTPKRCEATVMYRSTELIKKFVADLVFIPRVFERLDLKPQKVDFFFSNAYVSGVFFPSLFVYQNPIEFLEKIRKHDPEMFKVATRFLRRSVRTRDQEFPYSPEQSQHKLAWERYPHMMPKIQKYLKSHGVEA